MAYSEKVIDHYNDPKNVGSFKKDEENVGTGLVGAPECGDVMKLQIKVENDVIVDAIVPLTDKLDDRKTLVIIYKKNFYKKGRGADMIPLGMDDVIVDLVVEFKIAVFAAIKRGALIF